MSQAFVKLPIEAKRADILSRMDVLHDKLVEAREALNSRKQKRKTNNLNFQDYTINLQLNQKDSKPTYSYAATETNPIEKETVATNWSSDENSLQASMAHDGVFGMKELNNNTCNQRKNMYSEPIMEDKENGMSPARNLAMFKSPERKANKNRSISQGDANESPVRMLKQQLENYKQQNLISEQDPYGASYPLQLVVQNSLSTIPRKSLSNNKKYSTGSILSAEKSQYISSHPRFKLSNRYLDLSGCQWQSALMEDVNDFDESARSKREKDREYKEISFIPSIFQKKTIRPKKKKPTKQSIEISADVRDKVANLIKERLKFNQQIKETTKKQKNTKQSYNEFLQTADLQKKLKETLVKKALAMNGLKADK